jgi:hypothetical protein
MIFPSFPTSLYSHQSDKSIRFRIRYGETMSGASSLHSLKRRLASVLATTKALGGLGRFFPNSFRCSSVGIVRVGTASHRTALKQDSITRVTKNSVGDPHVFGPPGSRSPSICKRNGSDPALDPSSDPSLFSEMC